MFRQAGGAKALADRAEKRCRHFAVKDTEATWFSHSSWSLPEFPSPLESVILYVSINAGGLLMSIFTRPRSILSLYARPHSLVSLLTINSQWSGSATFTKSV